LIEARLGNMHDSKVWSYRGWLKGSQ
jgi:hypothetical protein